MEKFEGLFAERLKELVLSREQTTDLLGKMIGVGGSTLRLWMNGKSFLRLSSALKLCDFFNCSLEFLFGRTDNMLDFTPKPTPPFYIRLKDVMEEKQISRYRILKELKKSSNHFFQWKKGSDPAMHTIIELADYFNMTIDCFVGREN